MELQIDVVSKGTIKPSRPTPNHLRHYQLSFLDQISQSIYQPLVLFFPNNDQFTTSSYLQKSDKLKKSLSDALAYFYPLCGRIQGNLFNDCNDEGIPISEAKVKCNLSDIISNPTPKDLRKLIPFGLEDPEDLPLLVQFNEFECGGVAIGLALSHKIGDALSTFSFVKFWAAITRKDSHVPCAPEFISASLFPPRHVPELKANAFISKKVVTRRFVFSTSSVQAIKARYAAAATAITSLKNQRPPSRIETLSLFIFNRFVSATRVESTMPHTYVMIQATNLRTRMNPPLPEHSFGNYYRLAMAYPETEAGDSEVKTHDLVSKVRESITRIDEEYMKKLKEGKDEFLDFMEDNFDKIIRGEVVTLNFTSLCKFPQYDADFGWGKPLWVGTPSLDVNNLVVFMDTASGEGIEALVNLKEVDMSKFEQDQELLSFVESTNG